MGYRLYINDDPDLPVSEIKKDVEIILSKIPDFMIIKLYWN